MCAIMVKLNIEPWYHRVYQVNAVENTLNSHNAVKIFMVDEH